MSVAYTLTILRLTRGGVAVSLIGDGGLAGIHVQTSRFPRKSIHVISYVVDVARPRLRTVRDLPFRLDRRWPAPGYVAPFTFVLV